MSHHVNWPASSRCSNSPPQLISLVLKQALVNWKKSQNKQTRRNSVNEDSVMTRVCVHACARGAASCSSFMWDICCPLKQVLIHLESQSTLMGWSLFTALHIQGSHFQQHTPVTHAAKQHCKCFGVGVSLNVRRSIVKGEWRCARLNSFKEAGGSGFEPAIFMLCSISANEGPLTIRKKKGQEHLVF